MTSIDIICWALVLGGDVAIIIAAYLFGMEAARREALKHQPGRDASGRFVKRSEGRR